MYLSIILMGMFAFFALDFLLACFKSINHETMIFCSR